MLPNHRAPCSTAAWGEGVARPPVWGGSYSLPMTWWVAIINSVPSATHFTEGETEAQRVRLSDHPTVRPFSTRHLGALPCSTAFHGSHRPPFCSSHMGLSTAFEQKCMLSTAGSWHWLSLRAEMRSQISRVPAPAPQRQAAHLLAPLWSDPSFWAPAQATQTQSEWL